MKESQLDNITASGPPLEILINSLEKLRDRRAAADREDIPSRYNDIKILKKQLKVKESSFRSFKDDFILTKANYLLSHSVGRPLKETEKFFNNQFFNPWTSSLNEPWDNWLQSIDEFTKELSKLFNANVSEFCPQVNLSSGLTKILMSLPDTQKNIKVILMSEVDFPGMGFTLKKSLPENSEIRFIPSSEDVTDFQVWKKYLTNDIDIIFISHAYSNTGQLSPVSEVLNHTRSHNIISILDIAQSAGIVPINLGMLQPDFMIGSCVKWLCGGPGAAFLWVNSERLPFCNPRDVGWFSHENPFEFDIHDFRYRDTALKFWGGTPSISPYITATYSLKFFNNLGISQVRKHNQKLIKLVEKSFNDEFVSPRIEAKRGGTMILNFNNHQEKVLKSLSENRISVDLRSQGIRISPHVYSNDDDMHQLIDVIKSTKF